MAEKKPQKVIPIIIEGFEINAPNVTFQKLQEFSLTLFEKLSNHRKERSFLLLERDKFRTILENTRHEIHVANATLKNKEEEIEKLQEKHRQDLKEVDQEVKYIVYDKSVSLSELKAWESSIMSKAEENHLSEEIELLQEKRKLKELVEEESIKHKDEVENLKTYYLQEVVNLEKECESEQCELEMDFKKNFNSTIQELTLKHEMEMSEVEERKNCHLAELKEIHKVRIDETKTFFNTITAENLTVIANLKQSLDWMKNNKSSMATELKLLKQENEKLKEPLSKSKYEVKNLTRQLINYEKDLLSLKNNKRMLKQTLEHSKQIKQKNNDAVRSIRGYDSVDLITNLDSSCLFSIQDFKCHTLCKKQRLEVLIAGLIEDLKAKQNTVQHLSTDPDIFQALKELKFKLWDPKRLAYELALICKAHGDLLHALEGKLEEFCIEEEFGFNTVSMRLLGAGSASLVSKQ